VADAVVATALSIFSRNLSEAICARPRRSEEYLYTLYGKPTFMDFPRGFPEMRKTKAWKYQ
jgi:hypothetical protein